MEYQSPSAAFSNAIEQHLMQAAQMKRQAALDKLAADKQSRDDEFRQAQMDNLQEERQTRHDEAAAKIGEQHINDITKTMSNMLPGDIPSADFIQDFDKVAPGAAQQAFPKPAESLPGLAANPEGTIRVGGVTPFTDPSVRPFVGNRVDREKADHDKKVQAISDRLSKLTPGTPEFMKTAMEYEMASNKTLPAGTFKAAGEGGGSGEAVARQNPRTGAVERLVDGQWTPIAGDVPKGTHFMTVPPPVDTTARDMRENTHRDQVHQQAITSFDKLETPYADQQRALNNLSTSLAQKGNPKADALIAIELLKSTVAGNGVRLTQPEITAELGGSRTKWQELQLKLNSWGGDDSKPLILTDEEKANVRKLAVTLRKKVRTQLDKINTSRDEVDNAKSPDEISKARTRLHKALSADEEDTTTSTTATPTSAADYIKAIRNGGK